MHITPRYRKCFPLFLVILIILTRIPVFTSLYFQADGDEAIVGLMAKDIADDGHFKIYFWGQKYGFATFETSVAAVSYKIFGMNVYSLKLSMLFLWIIGCLVLYYTIKRISGFETAALFALLMVCMPAWGLWSMKARGGYMTAWVFSAIAAWLMRVIYTNKNRNHFVYWIALAFCLVVIYFAQKLWLLSLFPFMGFLIIKRWGAVKFLIFNAAIFIFTWLFLYFARNEAGDFWAEKSDIPLNIFYQLPYFFARLQTHFTGAYFLGNTFVAGFFNISAGFLWIILYASLFIIQIWRFVNKRFLLLSHLLCLSVCCVSIVVFSGTGNALHFRYLLPIDVPLVFWLAVEISDLVKDKKHKIILAGFALVFMAFNAIGLYQLKDISIEYLNAKATESYTKAFNEMLGYLKQRHIYNTFSGNVMMTWQTPFYSNKTVYCRSFFPYDRNTEYIVPVTKAFLKGEPTAIIDIYNSRYLKPENPALGIDPQKIISFENQFRIYLYPDRKLLEGMGYKIE